MPRLAACRVGLVLLVAAGGRAAAHGVRIDLMEGGVAAAANYENGKALVFAEATVFAPGAGVTIHQQGFTDRTGRFAFLPDQPGEWRIVVDDGLGHRAERRVSVPEAGAAVPLGGWGRPDRLSAAVLGVGIVMTLFGGWALGAARRRTRRDASA